MNFVNQAKNTTRISLRTTVWI